MIVTDMLSIPILEDDDPFRIESKKKRVTDLIKEVNEKINSIESTRINMVSSKERLKEIEDLFNQIDDESNVFELIDKCKYDLNKLLQDLFYYDKFTNMLNLFKSYESDLKNISKYVNNIIINLEKLKDSEEFPDEYFANFVNSIYELSYKFMKYELLYTDDSKLLDYFMSNIHDYNYINLFIRNGIENLTSSINYIDGLNELMSIIDNRQDSNDFMDKKIILSLVKCEMREEYVNASRIKLGKYCNRFNDIYSNFVVDISELGATVVSEFGGVFINEFGSVNIRKIKKEYLELLKEYSEFIIGKDYLRKLNEREILFIDDMKLKIGSYIVLKEDLLESIYRLKRKVIKPLYKNKQN